MDSSYSTFRDDAASASAADNWSGRYSATSNASSSDETPSTSGSNVGARQESGRSQSKPAKSCKGCLYFSNLRQAQGGRPLCIGLSRKEGDQAIPVQDQQAPEKERALRQEFKYACVGYSLWEDTAKEDGGTQMPAVLCMGLEFIATKEGQEASAPHAPAGPSTQNGATQKPAPLPSPHPAPTLPSIDFWQRFQRSAGRLADQTLNNMQKIGSKIKEGISTMVSQDKDRPKP